MGIEVSYQRTARDVFETIMNDPDAYEDFRERKYERWVDLTARGEVLDIQAEWQVIHYLLTGEVAWDTSQIPPPLGDVVFGGTNTPYDATYNLVRYLAPKQVRGVADALRAIPPTDLRRKNEESQEATYKHHAPVAWDEETWQRILAIYAQLSAFFQAAANADDYVLLSFD